MKVIQTTKLKVGDIFANEIKQKGREAFLVTDIDSRSGKLTVISRNDPLKREKNINPVGSVYFLRNINS